MLSKDEIVMQSNAALTQWGPQWEEHAKEHSKYQMRPFSDFQNIGVGKVLLLVANGYSFEENIETIKKYRDNVDIMACDKTIGHLIENGIRPDYCMVCDANVNYEKYLEPYKDELYKTTLFMNVCGNPLWTREKWKKTYFFVNMDAIKSEGKFMKLSGCKNTIAAATNVSGAMVVLATQSNNQGRNNYFGYDKIVLIGFDYSWRPGGNYYSFDPAADGKRNYMSHIYMPDRGGEMIDTSHNLLFSARWLTDYINAFQLPVVSGTTHTIVGSIKCNDLESELQYRYKPEDGQKVRKMVAELRHHKLQTEKLTGKLNAMGQDHWQNYLESV